MNDYEYWFKEIMAIIHRDGCQYLNKHGIEKSAEDAIMIHQDNMVRIDDSRYAMKLIKRLVDHSESGKDLSPIHPIIEEAKLLLNQHKD